MKKKISPVALVAAIAAAILAVLRVVELREGFDPATGLTLHNIWNILPPVVFLAAAFLVLLLSRRLPKDKRPFREIFPAPQGGELLCGVIGGFLLAAGGAHCIFTFVSAEGGVIAVVTGGLAVLSGISHILLMRSLRQEDKALSAASLLPAMFFSVFLAFMAYLPAGTDPILSRYWLRVLAAALLACSFSLLAGFFKKETSPRLFVPVALLSVIAAAASLPGLPSPMLKMYVGSGLAVWGAVLLCLGGAAAPMAPGTEKE